MKSIVRTALISSAFITCISTFATGTPHTEMNRIEELLNDDTSPSDSTYLQKSEVRFDSKNEEYSGAWLKEYPTLSADMRDFWAGVGEPENGQDIEWFQQFFFDVNIHTFAHFDITKATAYQPIPFEKLSAKEAAQGIRWYSGAQAYLRLSPDYLRFYNNIIIPTIDRVLRKYAKKIGEVKTKAHIRNQSWTGIQGIKTYHRLYYRTRVESGDFFLLELSRIEDPESLYRKQEGDSVTVITTQYYLPAAFRSYFTSPRTRNFRIYAHALDGYDEPIRSCGSSEIETCWYWIPYCFGVETKHNAICSPEDKHTGDYATIQHTLFSRKSPDELWPPQPEPSDQSPKEQTPFGYYFGPTVAILLALVNIGFRIVRKLAN